MAIRLTRRTIGRTMIAVGVVGVIVSIAGVIVGQALIREVEESVDESLVLTNDALTAVSDSVAVTKTIVETLQGGLETIDATLSAVNASIGQTSAALTASSDFLGGSFPDSLEAVTTVLPTIERIASTIDDALRAVARAPFGPDYDPEQPFDEAIHQLTVAIEPIPGQLRDLADDSTGLAASAEAISDQVDALSQQIDALSAQLVEVSKLVDRYAATAAQASELTADSRDDLHASSDQTRVLLWLLGIVFALGQIVPIWLGIALAGSGPSPTQTIITRSEADRD